MSEACSAASPWRGVELLERAIGYTRGCLALVTDDLLDTSTPCAEWDLRELLVHMDDSLTSLHEAGAVRRVWLTSAPEPGGVALVDRLRQRACQLLADWSTGHGDVLVEGRPLSTPVLTSVGALEVAVHGWDVASACGATRSIPDALAEDLLRLAPVLVTAADRPARFGVPLEVASSAAPGERLLAYLGRSPTPAR